MWAYFERERKKIYQNQKEKSKYLFSLEKLFVKFLIHCVPAVKSSNNTRKDSIVILKLRKKSNLIFASTTEKEIFYFI